MDISQLRRYSPELKRLAKKYGIKRLYVIGSIARGESSDKSDIDLLVEMKKGSTLFSMAGFGYEAEQILGMRVDVIPSSILPTTKDRQFVENIERDAIAL